MSVAVALPGESEKVVLECYATFMVVQEGKHIPSIKQIFDLARKFMDMNCYDLVYPEVYTTMDERIVGIILDKNKYVHYKDGVAMYEAQNKIFEDWFLYQKLLMLEG